LAGLIWRKIPKTKIQDLPLGGFETKRVAKEPVPVGLNPYGRRGRGGLLCLSWLCLPGGRALVILCVCRIVKILPRFLQLWGYWNGI
jgi:hypothetical protein